MDKAGTFEYEIRKDFRNNQIVREVDERRLRDLWQSLGIGVLLVGVLLFSAWQHFELLRHGYRLEQMQRDRADGPPGSVGYGLGFWLPAGGGALQLEGMDAGCSFRSVHRTSPAVTYTVLANTTDGAWPVLRAIASHV